MAKTFKILKPDFELLNCFSQLFGVDMMFKSNRIVKIVTNYILFVCNISLIILGFVIDSFYPTYPLLCFPNSVAVAINELTQILGLLTSASIYLQVIFHKKTVARIGKHLQAADLLFSKLNIRFSYHKFNIVIKFSLAIIFALNLTVFAFFCAQYDVGKVVQIGLRFVTDFHPIIIIYLITLLDIYLCWLVRIKLCALSLLLSELCEFKDVDGNKSDWKVKLVQENPKIFFTDLIKISEIYEILYETTGDINSAFGWFTLASIALESISLTCHVFLLFEAATDPTFAEMKMEILVQVLWILLFSIPVALLIFVNYSTILQANQVSMVVYESVAGKEIEGSSMQLEMDLISLQLLHQQPYFTACGFFKIDMTLAFAIVGAVTTYLVILLQFNTQ